jgi:membrane fusion protein, heavy metal efflux system
MNATASKNRRRAAALTAAGLMAIGVGVVLVVSFRRPETGPPITARPETRAQPGATAGVVHLEPGQQRAIGLKVEKASFAEASDLLQAPGQVVPDETKFAYITPRAAGVVREVAAHEGQQVKAGNLLATIDSPEVAQARFDLYTRLQEVEIARDQADWQETVYHNTISLLERLKAGDSPEEIHRLFQDRPVGANREQLITAYAKERLAKATLDRKTSLNQQRIISVEQYQQTRAAYEAAEAAYKSLTEEMEYTARLARTQAQQSLKKASTALRVARERLRVLGVRTDGTEPPVEGGKVVGVKPDGTMPAGPDEAQDIRPEKILPGAREADGGVLSPAGARDGGGPPPSERPVSTYSIWAPFDGTILDRMLIVPGVYVDTTHRIFTLADISTVWVEVHVHESNYALITGGRDPQVRFTSPAYPGQTFEAEVVYKGDMVDPKSRTLKLLARAQNPGRLLKPGMFVDVDIRMPSGRRAALLPASAILSEGDAHLVFVQVAPGRFERRVVVTGSERGDRIEVLKGVEPGDLVVSEGTFKLKAESIRLSASSAAPEAPAAGGGKVVAR